MTKKKKNKGSSLIKIWIKFLFKGGSLLETDFWVKEDEIMSKAYLRKLIEDNLILTIDKSQTNQIFTIDMGEVVAIEYMEEKVE